MVSVIQQTDDYLNICLHFLTRSETTIWGNIMTIMRLWHGKVAIEKAGENPEKAKYYRVLFFLIY